MTFGSIENIQIGGVEVGDIYIDGKKVYSQPTSEVTLASGRKVTLYRGETTDSVDMGRPEVSANVRLSGESISSITEFDNVDDYALSVAPGSFSGFDRLRRVRAVSVDTVGIDAYRSCVALSAVDSTMQVRRVFECGFRECRSLSTLDFRDIEEFREFSFKQCEMLSTVRLYAAEVPTLAAGDAFELAGSGTQKGYTTVYVLDGLYKDYITATNWSAIARQISSFTQPVVTFISDATDPVRSVVKVETLNYGMSSVPPDVSKPGHRLTGWGNSYNDVTADVSCYAIWDRNMFDVGFFGAYVAEDHRIRPAQQVRFEEAATPPTQAQIDQYMAAHPELSGKYFSDWSNNQWKKVTCDLSVTAIFEPYLTITYEYQTDKSIISSQKYRKNSIVSYIDIPTRPLHWISPVSSEAFHPTEYAGQPISSDHTVYVIDTPKTIQVVSKTNSAKEDAYPHRYSIDSVSFLPEQAPVPESYDIRYREDPAGEWLPAAPEYVLCGDYPIQYMVSAEDFFTLICSDVFRITESDTYKLTYYFKNADARLSTVWHDGVKRNRPDPRFGEISDAVGNTISDDFVRWNRDDYLSATEDAEICALYAPKTFHVTFRSDGQLCAISSATWGENVYFVPEKPGWKFWNWVGPDGRNCDSAVSSVSGDLSADASYEEYRRLSVYMVEDDGRGTSCDFVKEYDDVLCSDSSFESIALRIEHDKIIKPNQGYRLSGLVPNQWECLSADTSVSAWCIPVDGLSYKVEFFVNGSQWPMSLNGVQWVKEHHSAAHPTGVEYQNLDAYPTKYFKGWDTSAWLSVMQPLSVNAVMVDRLSVDYFWRTTPSESLYRKGEPAETFISSTFHECGQDFSYSEIAAVSARIRHTMRGFIPSEPQSPQQANLSVGVSCIPNELSIISAQKSFVDDGTPHRYSVTAVSASPAEMSSAFRTVKYSYQDSGWLDQAPEFSEVGTYKIDFCVSGDGFYDLYGSDTMEIVDDPHTVTYIYKKTVGYGKERDTVLCSVTESVKFNCIPSQIPDSDEVDRVVSAHFVRWRPELSSERISADVTSTAEYEVNRCSVSYYNGRIENPQLKPWQLLSVQTVEWDGSVDPTVVSKLCCSVSGWKFKEWQDREGRGKYTIDDFTNIQQDMSAYAYMLPYVDLSIWQVRSDETTIGLVVSGETESLLSGQSVWASDISGRLPTVAGYSISGWIPEKDTWNPLTGDTSISAVYHPNFVSVDVYAKYERDGSERELFISSYTVQYGTVPLSCTPHEVCAQALSDYYILQDTWDPDGIWTKPRTDDVTATVKYSNKILYSWIKSDNGDLLSSTRYTPGDYIYYPNLSQPLSTIVWYSEDLNRTRVPEDARPKNIYVRYAKNTFEVPDSAIVGFVRYDEASAVVSAEDDTYPHCLSVISAELRPPAVSATPYVIDYRWYDADGQWSEWSAIPSSFFDAGSYTYQFRLSAYNFKEVETAAMLSILDTRFKVAYAFRNYDESQSVVFHTGIKKNRPDPDYEAFTTLSVPPITLSSVLTAWSDPSGVSSKVSVDSIVSALYEPRLFSVKLWEDGTLCTDVKVTYGANEWREPSKPGWKFWGWRNAAGTACDEALKFVSADVEASAYYEKYNDISAYRVDDRGYQVQTTFVGSYPKLCSETSFGDLTSFLGSELNVPNDMILTSWTPASWEYFDGPASVSANCTLKPDNMYTVQFMLRDQLLEKQNVKTNQAAVPPVVQDTREYYFKGWDTEDYKKVVRDLTVNAVLSNKVWVSYYYRSDSLSITEQDYLSGAMADYARDIGQISARDHYTTRAITPPQPMSLTSNVSAYVEDIKNTISVVGLLSSFEDDLESHGLSVTSVLLSPVEVASDAYSVLYKDPICSEWSAVPPSYSEVGTYYTDVMVSSERFDDLIMPHIEWKILDVQYGVTYYYDFLSSMSDSVKRMSIVHSVKKNRTDSPPEYTEVKDPATGSYIPISASVESADFVGWDPDPRLNPITSDLSVYQVTSPKILSVSYYKMDGTFISVETPIIYNREAFGYIAMRDSVTPPGWKFQYWTNEKGSEWSQTTFAKVKYDMSAYAYIRQYVSVDLYVVSSECVLVSSITDRLSGDVFKESDAEYIVGSAPAGYKNRTWVPAKTVTDGWMLSADLPDVARMGISAVYEQISGEVQFFENYPVYD